MHSDGNVRNSSPQPLKSELLTNYFASQKKKVSEKSL